MQRHWERTLHAEECLTISGDEIPNGESAIVISVRSYTHLRCQEKIWLIESPGLFRLLPRSSSCKSKRNVG